MHASTSDRVAVAVVLSTLLSLGAAGDAAAGVGSRGGGTFNRPGGFRGGLGRPRFAAFRPASVHGLPPISGVIHERPGGRSTFSPYSSAYGHTNTAASIGGFARGGAPGYGTAGAGLRYGVGRRFGAFGENRRRFAAGRGFVGGFGGFGGGYGLGYDGVGGAGFSGDAETYGRQGTYGQAGTYGGQGAYGQAGTYGGQGTYGGTATQSLYGSRGGVPYRSETPLAVRFAEPPLGPSPYAPYSPGDRYAYAAAADVGPGPHVVNPYRAGPPSFEGCGCGPRREPMIYRYGVGTAY